MDTDIVVYAGQVNMAGYLELTSKIEQHGTSSDSVFFIPVTTGGDPNAGYRMARALGHYYPASVTIGVPSVCKSAGTLMCIGGSELVVADRGELGPLDIQLSNKDEILGFSSGLDIMQALHALQDSMSAAFKHYLYDLKFGHRLGTKLASDIASNMAVGLVAPIAQQIDPVKLGEHQRAMQIAVAYGERLNTKFKNTDRQRIDRLLVSYPAHGFVIDRKEISELFNKVRSPSELENRIFHFLFESILSNYGHDVASGKPLIWVSAMEKILNMIGNPSGSDNNGQGVNDVDTQRDNGNVDDRGTAGVVAQAGARKQRRKRTKSE